MRVLGWLAWAVGLGMAACGSGSPSLNCGSGATGCSCSVVDNGTPATCDSTVAGGAVCCASPGYPGTSGTSCACIPVPQQVACTTASDGSTCSCSVGGDGGASSCSLATGVCCVNGGTCTCYANQTTCGPSRTSFSQCDATTLAQVMAEPSWCSTTQGPSFARVTACNPFQP